MERKTIDNLKIIKDLKLIEDQECMSSFHCPTGEIQTSVVARDCILVITKLLRKITQLQAELKKYKQAEKALEIEKMN